jgi:hypothetical protein
MSVATAMRSLIVTLVGSLCWGVAEAQDAVKRTGPSSPRVAAIPLRESGTVTFSGSDWFSWVNPARCDANGDVFVVPIPEADPRDVKNKSVPPRYSKKPRDIWKFSRDGRKITVFDLASVPVLTDAKEIDTRGIALGPDGSVFALVWAPRERPLGTGDQVTGDHYVVSFQGTGKYSSQIQLDEDEISPVRIDVFGSGELLLQGVDPQGRPRIGVMSAMGGRLQDLFGTPEVETGDTARPPEKQLHHLARGGDGRIYYVREDDSSVYAIASTGLTERVARLTRMPRGWQLVGLLAAGTRVAVDLL